MSLRGPAHQALRRARSASLMGWMGWMGCDGRGIESVLKFRVYFKSIYIDHVYDSHQKFSTQKYGKMTLWKKVTHCYIQ